MPVTQFKHPDPYKYQNGFDSYHEYVLKNHRKEKCVKTNSHSTEPKPSKVPFQ